MTWFGQLLGLEPRAEGNTGQYSGTANPAGWLTDLFGGVVTATGIRVGAEMALSVPGIAASVNVLSEDLAKVPLRVFRRNRRDGSHQIATDHPLHALLHDAPAPWLTSFAWRRSMVAAAMTRGNHYSRNIRNVRGDMVRLQPIKPGDCTVRWTSDGEPFFDVREGGYRIRMSYQDVLHIPYRADNAPAEWGGVIGVSPISRHAEAIALALAAERFAGSFFKNGARPSLAIEMDKKLPNDAVAARIRQGIERAYSGADNAFKVAILELGMKLKEVSFNNSDSQLIEVRKEAAVTMCQMFGVPPHKVGILDRATFSNIEQQSIDYVTGCVSSLAKAIESAITLTCLTSLERENGYYVEFDLNGLLRGDIQSRYRAYAIGRQWGWLSADDVRQWENLDPLPNNQGKTYLAPMNMTPADKLGEEDDKNDNVVPLQPPAQRKRAQGHGLEVVVGQPAAPGGMEYRPSKLLDASGRPMQMKVAAT